MTRPAGRSKTAGAPAKLLLQPAANAGELGSVFTNQKRSARPEFIEQRRFSDPRRTDYQDVATLQIKCPQLFKFRISAGKRKSHIDDPERVPPLIEISPFPLRRIASDLVGRFGIVLLGPNHAVVDPLLPLLEQILEDELTPSAAACVHQRATLVELSQLDGCEPELFGQIRHGIDRVIVVARQKDDPVPTLDDRIGSQGGRSQVIETFHELSAGERLRNEGGGQEAVQLLKGN